MKIEKFKNRVFTPIYWVIGVRLPVVADARVEKFKILRKIVKRLEKDGVKESMARNGIKPVDESVVKLKILITSLS